MFDIYLVIWSHESILVFKSEFELFSVSVLPIKKVREKFRKTGFI